MFCADTYVYEPVSRNLKATNIYTPNCPRKAPLDNTTSPKFNLVLDRHIKEKRAPPFCVSCMLIEANLL